MECALCKEEKDLRDSHIISSFLFKPLREGKKPNFFELSTDSDQSRSIVQDGPTDPLLCDECEQHRSQWEKYFSQLWYNRLFPDSYPAVLEVDYSPLKLYQMSTLFVAARSKHAFFEQVRMPADRQEQLRKMLLSESPGPAAEFGCAMFALVHDEITDARRIVSSGHTRQRGELRIHQFMFGGFLWVYVDGDTDLVEPSLKERFVQRSGRWRIESINPESIGLFTGSISDLKEQKKLDGYT